jgi:hypothetical protein
MSDDTVWTDNGRIACLGSRNTIRYAPAVIAMFPELGTAQRGLLITADRTLEEDIIAVMDT